jgi:signal transduction histidine kinase
LKLLSKYNRVNILATILVLLLGGLCYYYILRTVLLHQLDSDLKLEEQEIRDYVLLIKRLPNEANYKDQKIEFESSEKKGFIRKIRSIDLFNASEDEYIASRQLIFSINCAGKNYNVSITKSQEETEDLIQLIVFITLAIVVLLLVVLFIINRFVLNKLWYPFNKTLSELKQFNLSSENSISLNESSINEFNELNFAVLNMKNRVLKDYDALKSFTENASHEIQTPLAIISSKLELLMQSENFTELQMQYIQNIHEEISRLSKLNQSLLLLTKIDNQEFQDIKEIDLTKIITKQLNNYEELIAAKQITLTRSLDKTFVVVMNEIMAEVLISNLITNAIKHNIEKGTIDVMLNNKQLIVSNTGPVLNANPNEMFDRFKKDNMRSDSLGLGLSIVKKIGDLYHLNIDYSYKKPIHYISILFS